MGHAAQEHRIENLFDFISIQFAPLESLFEIADRTDDKVISLLDIAEPTLCDVKKRIDFIINAIHDRIGSIDFTVQSGRPYYDSQIIGASFTPTDEQAYQDHLKRAQACLDMCKQGAFINAAAYPQHLREAIKEAEAVTMHAEEMKHKAEVFKAAAEELLENFNADAMTIRPAK